MQFSDTSNGQGIIQDITLLTGQDINAYPLADRVRGANSWYYQAVSWIWQATSTWEWDDANLTDLPIATTTLVVGQADYAIPTDTQKIDRIEVLNNNNDYRLLTPLDKSQIPIATTEFHETDGFPVYWDLVGNSLILYPAPSAAQVTTALGLKIYFSRDINEFTASDTTQEPGFKPDSCHRILSIGASLDYAIGNGYEVKIIDGFRENIEDLKKELQEFHGYRDRSTPVQMRVRTRRYI